MKKQFLFLSTVMFCVLGVFAQTPFDSFAPEQSVKPMIELSKKQFKVANTDTNSEISHIEFDKNTLFLCLLDNNDSVIKVVALNSNDRKWLSVDPMSDKYPSLSPYNYCANNPLIFIDPDGRTPRIFVETKKAGHVFVTAGEGANTVVYSYGRYAGTDKQKSSAQSTSPTGAGVLIRLTGEDAQAYIKNQLENNGAQAYEFSRISDEKVMKHFDNMFNSSNVIPNQGKYAGDENARIIDTYDLFNNNCTTKSIEGVLGGTSYAPEMKGTFIPADLKGKLEGLSKTDPILKLFGISYDVKKVDMKIISTELGF